MPFGSQRWLTIKKEKGNKELCAIEKIISKIAGFEIPGLILVVAIYATGLPGGAAITAALSSIGPAGMIAGIATLVATALITEAISKLGISAVYSGVETELYKKVETKESIISKINNILFQRI